MYSDIACPWCYMGFIRLHRAITLAKSEGFEVKVEYVPAMIDPKINAEGEEYLAYNNKKWGGDYWTSSMKQSAL